MVNLRGSTPNVMHTVMGSELTITPQERDPGVITGNLMYQFIAEQQSRKQIGRS